MAGRNQEIANQLKSACAICNATWAVWVSHDQGVWSVQHHSDLTQAQLEIIGKYLAQPLATTKLAKGLTRGQMFDVKTEKLADLNEGQPLYVFPNPHSQALLIVSAYALEEKDRAILGLLAQGGIPKAQPDMSVEQSLAEILVDLDVGVSYDLESVLRRVLQMLVRYIASDSACIGLRYGDVVRLEAAWTSNENSSAGETGFQVSIHDNVLDDIVNHRAVIIVNDIRADKPFPLLPDADTQTGSWLGIPLLVGRRVIGIVCFYSDQCDVYNQEIAQRATVVAAHLAPTIETSVALAEATLHLEKLALLNEIASAAAASTDADEVATQIIRRLKRIFKTEMVSILLLTPERDHLLEFGESFQRDPALVLPVSGSLSGYVVETGMPMRVGDVASAPRYYDLGLGVRSELAVPLIYRGNIIGVLDLESLEPDAFSLRDEQLLVVMASQLAGLIENVRLHDVTMQRARNLDVIHQVVQEVVGLTDIDEIARVAAQLMAERFEFELAVVSLVNEQEDSLVIVGMGGDASPEIVPGVKKPIDAGISGRVCREGKSYLINDTSEAPDYYPFPGWSGGSEMCVPLREGEFIFGVVNVERPQKDAFSRSDLVALEALAGVLSSVMINARSYQQLRVNLRHLQAVRETAIDISADLDLDLLLERVTNRVRELVGAKGAELGLVNEEKEIVEIKVSENPWEGYSKGLILPFGYGVAGHMAVDGKPISVTDYASWAGRLELGKQAPFTSVAGVPLKYKDKVIGTLTIASDEEGSGFDPEDVRLLELLAPQVAVSVRNARLYQELQSLMKAERLAKDHLVQSGRLAAVGELAAGVAHELNNPLTTVAGFVELVLDDLPNESPHRPDLELVLREARRAREVVRRLLDFSRPGEGFRVRSDINGLVRDVVALIRHLTHTNGIEIRERLEADIPLIWVDQDQIQQVLLNLVHNAIHAMPRGGALTISTCPKTREKRAGLSIQVADTGIGISKENMRRLFEPFFTTRPPGKGTGLGLSVSYGIITDHGGAIDVESEPNHGSTFSVWLPEQSNRALL